MAEASRRWFVSGQVQGVGFRFFVQKKAAALGLSGWARNTDDGRVEVYAAGDPHRLEDLTEALRVGPKGSRVTRLEEAEAGREAVSSFEIR